MTAQPANASPHAPAASAPAAPVRGAAATADANPVIHADRLTKTFGTVHAVQGVSFDVPRGRTTALLGANGAGKTTTIAMLLGLLLPTSGTVEVLGHDMVRARHRANDGLDGGGAQAGSAIRACATDVLVP